MSKLLLCILAFSFLSGIVTSSAAPIDSTTVGKNFATEVTEMMEMTKSQTAIALASAFSTNWDNGTISVLCHDKIDSIASIMAVRNLPAIPYYSDFIRLINGLASGKISTDKMEKVLPMIKNSLASGDNRKFAQLLVRLNNFLDYHAIYYSNFYRLYTTSNDIDFEYSGEEPASLLPLAPAEKDEADNTPATGSSGSLDTNSATPASSDGWGTTPTTSSSNGWDTPANNASDTGAGNSGWDTGNAGSGGWSSGWSNATDTATEQPALPAALQTMNTSGAFSSAPLPLATGLTVKFSNTDLIFVTPYDSTSINGTSGTWSVSQNLFLGDKGTFDWAKAGYEPGKVVTEFDKFYIDTDRPVINAENVTLKYPDRFDKPIEGVFSYASTPPNRTGKVLYPKFTSYYSNFEIKFPEDESIKIKGGFSVVGNKISTRSLLPGKTLVEDKDGKNLRFRAIGEYFQIGDSSLVSPNTSITLFQGSDSIYHPAVRFTYNAVNRDLLVEKAAGKNSLTPYVASYYKMEIDANSIRWNLDSDSLDIFMSRARNIVPARFISDDYFNKTDLESLSKPFSFNPLLLAVNYARKSGSNDFNSDDLARRYKLNPASVKAGMKALDQNNFIDFNNTTGEVKLENKAFNYTDAHRGIRDYDDLLINSISGTPTNATINLEDNDMEIRGIDRFFISQTLDVFILPDSNRITVQDNRNLKFNGRLVAGNFEFIGTEFLFKYDSFYVDMNHIDSIRFYIDDPKTGQKKRVENKLVSIDTANTEAMNDMSGGLSKTSGRLFINLPDNKSGKKIYPGYPSFDAGRGAVVYFNNPDILNGAYNQSVYFVIPPFKIDSLSDSDPSTIGFDGKFYSGGMLPPFNETLHVMPDNSLGFEHDIAPEGYALYGGSGKIYNHLKLDKTGLTASGNIQYLTSTLNSDNLTFYTDSLTGNGTAFKMQAGELNGGSFPDASIGSFRMKWLPRSDSMYITNIDKPFNLYNSTASLSGTLNVNKKGAYGIGKLTTRKSETQSKEFFFNQTRFEAHHAQFKMQSNDPQKPILYGDNVKLFFNLDENYADIGPEVEGEAAMDFPYAQFKTSIPTARWDLNNRTVVMKKPDNVDINSSYFYATRPDLDSLAFNATSASYNIDNYQLLVKGIPYIKVADAKITPENNQVLVLENARIGTLKNTNIEIDTLTGYHHLYDGTIDIISRNKFEGSATYRFVNTVKDTFAIKIDKFELVPDKAKGRNNRLHTQASGFVNAQDNVVISPGMVYKGDAIMYAPDPAFALDGFVKLQYRPNPKKDIWIKYQSSETSTQKVRIDFNTARTEDDEPLTAGIFYNEDNQLYSLFVNPKKSVLDQPFFTPDGMLTFDADSSAYRIDDTLKTDGSSFKGRIFDLNIKTNNIQFEGPVDFNIKSKGLELQASVIGRGNDTANIYSMDAFLTLNYSLPSQVAEMMSTEIAKAAGVLGLPQAYGNDPSLLYKVSEIIGENATEDYEQKSLQAYTPLISISPRLDKSIVISKVNLFYDPKNKAWFSKGKIGISNIGRQDVNVLANGFLEIKKAESGDMVNLFLQISPTIWYYFNFQENRLLVASTNADINELIKGKSNALKANFGEYFFLNGEDQDVLSFINQFRKDYLNISEPYDLMSAPSGSDTGQPTQKNNPVIPKEMKKQDKKDDEGF